jgi:hypothetical protein
MKGRPVDTDGKIAVAVIVGIMLLAVVLMRAEQAEYRDFCREIAGNNLALYEECLRAPGADGPGPEHR